ncbi:hypothetical protein GCM10010112_32720 [Actinoplanes lobatus]|uniref:Regulatory protein FmdB Zinc ribbon domain-containing protein n=1 Tax=Actinoplanes lobatus TaxID=113568 RepID=A0ABQ4A7X3_9ACTN|nr:hypothetical protein GCM10010112_32720 [Actinoplanes lobatus]GIE37107.1 hypothetical protein Alo02nite_00050 [Actinoplanes lobatus]
MYAYQCPTCDTRCQVADSARANTPCSMCEARLTWESLAPRTQHFIDAAIRRGSIQGVVAMSEANPPIRMPHSLDLLAFRERAGVKQDRPS